jgi:hypothetical protein
MKHHPVKLLSGFFGALLILSLTGCFSQPTTYAGLHYPPTEKVDIIFQENAVPHTCQGFAHLLVTTAAPASGVDIQTALIKEAREKGASKILVGMAREEIGAKPATYQFDYFGPEYPYPFPQGWMGWKFGIRQWEKSGHLMGFGLQDWGNPDRHFDYSLKIQAAFLRCQ